MTIDETQLRADPALVSAWVAGWALCRGAPPPVADAGGLRVEVGLPQQRRRYVFAGVSDDLSALAGQIDEPWVLLKVAGPPAEVPPLLPPRWVVQPPTAMMTAALEHGATDPRAPDGYTLTLERGPSAAVTQVLSPNGEPAARGSAAFVGDTAIFDQIRTQPDHLRRGLGGLLMRTLEVEARERGATRGVLVATAEGRALYATLGWTVHCLYTTALIPGAEG
jgi:GNAT superfamily N-acetyltransferase